jgi:uncharacterized protein
MQEILPRLRLPTSVCVCHAQIVPVELCAEELRVLGALVEKDLTTPEYYPLSLNALVNACNQKTNREPVVSYDEQTARAALESLRDRGLAVFVHESGSRVEKYRHKLGEAYNFTRGELALIGVLMLRGPQTAAELRERTQRMHAFEDLEVTTHALEKLAERELARLLPRVPGQKEQRWAQLFGGEPDMTPAAEETHSAGPSLPARIEALEREVAELREQFAAFRRQFE